MPRRFLLVSGTLFALVAHGGCGSSRDRTFEQGVDPATPIGGENGFDGGTPGPGGPLGRDPETCAEALQTRSYVGCDYWPTVTANSVWSIFDYAVVVSNTGKAPADVTVTGPNNVNVKATVAPGALEKIYLPWVPELKGPDGDANGAPVEMTASVLAKGGAYHLVSTSPVVVYQFNALEYKGAGGPPGKSWASCPAPSNCFSFTNDASLLLPSTAWTTSYRVTGVKGWTSEVPFLPPVMGGYVVITASQNGTKVDVALGSKANVLAGGPVPASSAGGSVTLTLDAGDAVELVTPKGETHDMSGSLITSSAPVQVITGIACTYIPKEKGSCDHVEEAVVPAEALGKRYVVTSPTKPGGGPGLHVVRFYGNRDGTSLTYAPSKPQGCPDALNAGQVAECGPLSPDFVVEGSAEFGVSGFMVGASLYTTNPNQGSRGDPSQTSFAAVEQFRRNYLFLAPDDYEESYAVVVGPSDAAPEIDGAALSGFAAVDGKLGVWRAKLGAGKSGAHTLTSKSPVGLQVMGYGAYTSYNYPGGLNLDIISPPPPPR